MSPRGAKEEIESKYSDDKPEDQKDPANDKAI